MITFDLRNHGRSGRSEGGYRVSALAADLDQLLTHLGVATAHLLGHSMGASVLWSCLELYGSARVRSLVFVDEPAACAAAPWFIAADSRDAGVILNHSDVGDFVSSLVGDNAAAVRRAFLEGMLSKDLPAADLDWLYERNLLMALPWGAKLLLDHVQQDWRDVLPGIAVPTLVVGGSHFPFF
ncbi:hypothetical protein GCM10022267_75410 [Lentzea roselyniae]|uniref:AB hydrolase-1 domain-containing protein n=1 Tax=Lentzea roselyniae TaxID=531940 RepID=A0ABP7C2Y7_9PSEU